jgi:hypothetical protein
VIGGHPKLVDTFSQSVQFTGVAGDANIYSARGLRRLLDKGQNPVARLQCMEEVAAVARARGIQLDDTVVIDTMRYVDSLAANATTSLQRDIAEGKLSEIDY